MTCMNIKSKLAKAALAAFSVWVPLAGIILYFICKKREDLKTAKLFAVCSAVGFIINFVPRLLGVM